MPRDINDHKPGTLKQTKVVKPGEFEEYDGAGMKLNRASHLVDGRLQVFYQMIWSFVITDEKADDVLKFERVLGERSPGFLHDCLLEAKKRSL